MKLKTDNQVKIILRTIGLIFSTREMGHLNDITYKFLYLCSGFIAHYDIHGFRYEYQDVDLLASEIMANIDMNQWSNFSPSDRDYEYYMQKRDIYNKILAIVDKVTV